MAGIAMRMLVLTFLTFKKVKLIFGHPVYHTAQQAVILYILLLYVLIFIAGIVEINLKDSGLY